jgi:hypothetical protein
MTGMFQQVPPTWSLMTAAEKWPILQALVEEYDTDRHRVGSDLLAWHYKEFWTKVRDITQPPKEGTTPCQS